MKALGDLPSVAGVELDLETLRGTGCEGQEKSRRDMLGPVNTNYGWYCTSSNSKNARCEKTERRAGTSALTLAATTADKPFVIGATRATFLLGAVVVRIGYRVTVLMVRRSTNPVHRAWRDVKRGAAQRRDPGREKKDGQSNGERSAHHGCESTLRSKCPSGTPSREGSEIQNSVRWP